MACNCTSCRQQQKQFIVRCRRCGQFMHWITGLRGEVIACGECGSPPPVKEKYPNG